MASQNIWSIKDSQKRSQERRAQTTRFLLNPRAEDMVLDIGCSEGFVTSKLLTARFVVGVDASREALLLASKRLRQSNIAFIYADAAFLPFRDGFFDKICLLEVLEHLPVEKQKRVCIQADSVLKQGGCLVISVPYKEKILKTKCVCCGESTPLWGHVESMDEHKVSSVLPHSYIMQQKVHLINIVTLSQSPIAHRFPFRTWLALNNLLGRMYKGYWVMVKFKKR